MSLLSFIPIVRSKVEQLVKTKLVDIVNEMRKKTSLATSSFKAVHKWAEPRIFKESEETCSVQANANLTIEQESPEEDATDSEVVERAGVRAELEPVLEENEELPEELNNTVLKPAVEHTHDKGEVTTSESESWNLPSSNGDNHEHHPRQESQLQQELISTPNHTPEHHNLEEQHPQPESLPTPETHSQPESHSNKKSLITIFQKLSLGSIDATSSTTLNFPATSLAVAGKNKISELYDKLSRSKERYRPLKSLKMELSKTTNSSDAGDTTAIREDTVQEADEDGDDENMNVAPRQPDDDKTVIFQFQFDESMSSPTENGTTEVKRTLPGQTSVSDDEPNAYELRSDTISPTPMSCSSTTTTTDSRLNITNAPLHQRRIGIGDIGRSVSDNPANSKSGSKKCALADIGRSFSVAHDEEAFVPGEGNNSCPNPSSLNTSSIIGGSSSNNISTSHNNNNNSMLATSVPASPMTAGRVADPRAIANALRARRQLLRDSSFQVSETQGNSIGRAIFI